MPLAVSAPSIADHGSRKTPSSNTDKGTTSAPVASSGTFSGLPCDPYAFRRIYPQRWSEFLHRNFHSAAHVGFFFSIDEATARNWWHGKTGPQGWAVAYAVQSFPEAQACMDAA